MPEPEIMIQPLGDLWVQKKKKKNPLQTAYRSNRIQLAFT